VRAVQTRQILGAAERSEDNTLDKLIKDSVDVNLHNKFEQSALHVGAQRDNVEFITTLLSSGRVELDSKDIDGMTALHLVVLNPAGKTNSKKIAEELMKAGADPYVENSAGHTPETLVESLDDDSGGIKTGLRQLFERPPLVEGPRVKKKPPLQRNPTPGGEQEACKATETVATEIFNITDDDKSPERHMTAYPSVLDLVYSDRTIDEIFDSVRPDNIRGGAFCRWYHIPANNVSQLSNILAQDA
jgi:hypothetical protein